MANLPGDVDGGQVGRRQGGERTAVDALGGEAPADGGARLEGAEQRAEAEAMPTDACSWFYDCKGCF